jgi:hypothetical protein
MLGSHTETLVPIPRRKRVLVKDKLFSSEKKSFRYGGKFSEKNSVPTFPSKAEKNQRMLGLFCVRAFPLHV